MTFRSGSDRAGAVIFFLIGAAGFLSAATSGRWWHWILPTLFVVGGVQFLRQGVFINRTTLVAKVDFRKSVLPLSNIREVRWEGLSGLIADTGTGSVRIMRLGGLRPDLRAAEVRSEILRAVEADRLSNEIDAAPES